MIIISQTCTGSLDQEPGGAMCIQYHYRVSQSSTIELLKLKGGTAIIEVISNNELKEKQVSELFSLDQKQIQIVKSSNSSENASSKNPVPG